MSIQSIPSGTQALEASVLRQNSAQPAPRAASGADGAAAAQKTPELGSTQAASPTKEALLQAVDDVRQALKPVAQNLLFSIDEDSGKTVVKVVDSSTDEVIRQIPSEEILAISKAIDKLQGVLIQQKA